MSQNLANDLPDRFASSDEDEDDEEVVGWMGETGEFEPATSQGEDEGGDEEVNVMREFGRRGLFQERWDSEFPDDDEYEFRNAQPSPPMEGHDDPVDTTPNWAYRYRVLMRWRTRITLDC